MSTVRRVFLQTALLTLLLGGCDTIAELLDPPGEGFFDLFIQIDGDPAYPVEGVRLNPIAIQVVLKRAGATDEEIITIRDDIPEAVIASHAFGIPHLVARASIPIGEIQQVRIILASASLREAGSGSALTVTIPSSSQRGLVGVPRDDVVVPIIEAGQTRALVSVDLSTQLIKPPGKGPLLKPISGLSIIDRAVISDFVEPTEVVLSAAHLLLPETGVALDVAKIIDTKTGAVRNLAIDSDGVERDLGVLSANERAAYVARKGALTPGFARELERIRGDEVLELEALVLTPPRLPYVPLKTGTLSELNAHFDSYRNADKLANAPFVTAAVNRILQAGALVTSRTDETPLVRFSARADVVESVIAFLPELGAIDTVKERVLIGYESALDLAEHALFPAYANQPLASARDVSIVIDEPSCADGSHPAFSQALVLPPIGDSDNITNHATRVMSVAASTSGGQFAGAYRATLQSVCSLGFNVADLRPDVWNQSFVISQEPSLPNAARDRDIFMGRLLLVRGSGNSAAEDARCFEYNAVCVGGYDGERTYGVDLSTGFGPFHDDSSYGSYINQSLDPDNPAVTLARERPDVVAKANPVRGAILGGGFSSADGTSYASPAVAGLEASLISRVPVLRHEPTAMRALLMASAHHNIEDSAVPLFNDDIDDKDGAGAPRADRALIILSSGNLQFGVLDRDLDFDATGSKRVAFQATGGQLIRVVLTWDACPYTVFSPSGFTGLPYDYLPIDLDLVVEGPEVGGAPLLKTNPSLIDNYEIVEFIVPKSGMWAFRIQATNWRPGACNELDPAMTGARRTFYALAWDVRAPQQ